jgi:hypothetical protein
MFTDGHFSLLAVYSPVSSVQGTPERPESFGTGPGSTGFPDQRSHGGPVTGVHRGAATSAAGRHLFWSILFACYLALVLSHPVQCSPTVTSPFLQSIALYLASKRRREAQVASEPAQVPGLRPLSSPAAAEQSSDPVSLPSSVPLAGFEAEVRKALSEDGYYILTKEQWCTDLTALAALSSTRSHTSASAWSVVEELLSRPVGHERGGSGVFHRFIVPVDTSRQIMTDYGGNQRMQLVHPGINATHQTVATWKRLSDLEKQALEDIYKVHGRLQPWLYAMFPDRLGLSYMHSPVREGVTPEPQTPHPDFQFNKREEFELSQVSTIVAGEHPASLWVWPRSHTFLKSYWMGSLDKDHTIMQDALNALEKVQPEQVHWGADSRIIFHKYLLHAGPAKGRARVHEYRGSAHKTCRNHPNLTDVAVPLDSQLAAAIQPVVR